MQCHWQQCAKGIKLIRLPMGLWADRSGEDGLLGRNIWLRGACRGAGARRALLPGHMEAKSDTAIAARRNTAPARNRLCAGGGASLAGRSVSMLPRTDHGFGTLSHARPNRSLTCPSGNRVGTWAGTCGSGVLTAWLRGARWGEGSIARDKKGREAGTEKDR